LGKEIIERSFPVKAPAFLKLSNIRGSVEIFAGEEDIVSISAVKHLNSGNADHTEVNIHQQDDGKVIIETHQDKHNGFFSILKPCKVDYRVSVPEHCSVELNCVSSKADIQGLVGEFSLNTVSGAIDINQISGPVKVVSVSGPISAKNLAGHLDGGSVSGKIRVMESQLSHIEISTVSGNITVQTPLSDIF